MTITADKLVVDDVNQTAEFSGSVLVTRLKTTLNSDTLVVFYNRPIAEPKLPLEKTKTNQTPFLTKANINKLISKGNVLLKTPEYTAKSQKGEYHTASQLLTLTGEVILNQGGHRAEGEKFIYDYNQQKGKLINHTDKKGSQDQDKQRAKLTIKLGENAR
jgi:lipopolysaccharide transport protein LptA